MNTNRLKSSGPWRVSRLTGLLLIAIAGMATLPTITAGDWSYYRGPNYDGSSAESIRINWSEEPPARETEGMVRVDPDWVGFRLVAFASAKTDCKEVQTALKRWESLVVPEMETWLSQYRMTSSPDSVA